ncbi:MAG: restriction endonuclease subunit S [Hyphomicrobiales bacterium]|nr:restriction endonuclease subunit S [Hyphomicrobiales bacterium]
MSLRERTSLAVDGHRAPDALDSPAIPPGYKQTEAGVIPEDWILTTLGGQVWFRTGPFGSALHKSDYTTDGIPVVNPMHIVDGRIVPTASMTITETVAQHLADFRLKPGDIIIGRRGEMGRCAVVNSEQDGWLCGTGSMIIRCCVDVEPEFLQRVLASRQVIAAIEDNSVGSTMINLNQSTLAGLIIQFPPLPEQRAIAAALSDVDALIAKKRAIKTAAMQQLLTGKTRLPGFSGEWDTQQLGEFAEIRNQKAMPNAVDAETLCIELEHISQGNGRLLGHSTASESKSSKYYFVVGDVLFGRLRPYLRKFWFADRHGLCSTEIWPLMVDHNQANSAFLFQVVQTDQFIEAASVSYGTHMPRADWGIIRDFEFALPCLKEQAAIAAVLSDMDAEIAALEARRDKTSAIKQGMMQELLTGRIRLL